MNDWIRHRSFSLLLLAYMCACAGTTGTRVVVKSPSRVGLRADRIHLYYDAKDTAGTFVAGVSKEEVLDLENGHMLACFACVKYSVPERNIRIQAPYGLALITDGNARELVSKWEKSGSLQIYYKLRSFIPGHSFTNVDAVALTSWDNVDRVEEVQRAGSGKAWLAVIGSVSIPTGLISSLAASDYKPGLAILGVGTVSFAIALLLPKEVSRTVIPESPEKQKKQYTVPGP